MMSDDDRISNPVRRGFPMTDDIDFAQMYQPTIAPLGLSEEQKKYQSEQQYRELAISKSSRFGTTDAFIMDSTPIRFDGPLDQSGFIREIILAISAGESIDIVRYSIERNLLYSDMVTDVAEVFGSVVLTPTSKTINGSSLRYFSITDANNLEINFQLYFSVEADTGVVSVFDTMQVISKEFITPFAVAIIAIDLCMFKKQENPMTENQNTLSDKPCASPDDRIIMASGHVLPLEEVATINGHLQLRPDDVTIVNDGVNSAIATFTVQNDMIDHFTLKRPINELRFEKMYPDVKIPQKQTSGSAGMDVHAYLPESVVIPPGERRLIPTGLKTCFPDWMELQVRSRSGLALKHGIIVLNAPGTIDADYPGELGVILYNTSMTPYLVQHDARIAQLVPAQVLHIPVVEGVREEETSRTSSGFGSTGV